MFIARVEVEFNIVVLLAACSVAVVSKAVARVVINVEIFKLGNVEDFICHSLVEFWDSCERS